MGYYGVQLKSGGDIEHWKYIKREKRPDGTFRYYYSHEYDNKYKAEVTEEQKYTEYFKEGGKRKVKEKTHYTDVDKLLSKKIVVTQEGYYEKGTRDRVDIFKNRGKIERTLDKAQAKIEKVAYNSVLSEKSPANRLKNTGKNLVDKLLKKKK